MVPTINIKIIMYLISSEQDNLSMTNAEKNIKTANINTKRVFK